MANNNLRNCFRVTTEGGYVSLYWKRTNAVLIRSVIINNSDITLLTSYVDDLERALYKYSKAAEAARLGNKSGSLM